MHDLEDTIVAVATPPGRGGVGCVRLSGPDAERIAASLFRSHSRLHASPLHFGRFLDPEGRPLDHGYLVRFDAARSFTGEPTAELWAHGSPPVLTALVESAIAAGARAAGPGEFTYRALRHGRLDLARAEAVRDLVAARTLWQARTAFAQAEGNLSRRLAPLRETLVDLAARAEAAVEFVDESETAIASEAFGSALHEATRQAEALRRAFRAGARARDGAVVAITGLPNVGKSSLFNALLARDRAIVSEIPGTTRDTLEDLVDLDGVPVRLVDTAGLRRGEDSLEVEGVRRARAARAEADLVILLLDRSRGLEPAEREALAAPDPERTWVIVNKADLPAAERLVLPDALSVSARTGQGLDELRRRLRDRILGGESLEDAVLADARHARALDDCAAAIGRGRSAFLSGLSEEAVLEDLREALDRLGEITGECGTEELLDRVFATFCIGK